MSSIPSWSLTDVQHKTPAADLTASTTLGTGTEAGTGTGTRTASTGTAARYWYRAKRLVLIGHGVPLNVAVLVGWSVWERIFN